MSHYRRPVLFLALAVLLALLAGCATKAPTDQTTYNGVPVGITDEGYAYMGSVDAPVTMEEFTDFVCPYCSRHVLQVEPSLIETYISTGKVRLIFRNNPIASLHPTSAQGHEAALCVSEQGAAMFWEMHDRLFNEQSTWSALDDPTDYLAGVAKDVGANKREYEACLTSGRATEAVNASIAEATSYGYTGTPMFRLTATGVADAYTIRGAETLETFTSYIDALLAGEAPAAAEEESTESQLPVWARTEGRTEDPIRAGYTQAGDPFKGTVGAPLTVVEFSNFQCTACGTHALQVQPTLDTDYVDTGKVLWVFKNMPTRDDAESAIAGAAAECAGDQGQFWAMHDLLFNSVDTWAVDDPAPALETLAGQLGLDATAFATCLDGRDAMQRVMDDLYDAQEMGSTAPLFVVLYNDTGRIISGSLPVDQFEEALDSMLTEATSGS